LFVDDKFLRHCYTTLQQYYRSAGRPGTVLPCRQCLILSVEGRDDPTRLGFSDDNRNAVGAASLLRVARARPRSLTMQSTRLTATTTALALLTALGLFADRDVATFVLLAGLAAILGVLMMALLLADALARPLVELAGAVAALARDKSARPNREDDMQRDNVVALQLQARSIRMVVAAVESVSRRKALGAAIATGNPAVQRRYRFTRAHAIGTYIDIVIPSDRRE
jgi:hypothetical protein